MRNDHVLPFLVALAIAGSATASAQTLTTRRVASGLERPLWAGAPAGDPRIFVLEKRGLIKVFQDGALVSTFLDIRTQVSTGSEQGLLGIAFHPDYATNGTFYLDYTDTLGDTVVSAWQVSADPNVADPNSETPILGQGQPATNHNAGAIQFGLDGYLYITFGDGGFGADCNAQDLGTWLGKILRIDVDSAQPYAVPPDNPFVGVPGARPEIWHVGLRNPWRMSIDRATGDMYIGDVGENSREEISFAAAGVGGVNFGWRKVEGTICRGNGPCGALPECATFTPPLTELVHSGFSGPLAIVGGYVYRGCAIPSLRGTYFFADYSDDRIRSFEYDPGTGVLSNFTDRTTELDPPGAQTITNIASFGEDGQGELLIVDHSSGGNGEVFQVVTASAVPASAAQRNGSGVNATCYASLTDPVIGRPWRAAVDASGHPGATIAGLAWYDAPIQGVFVKGSELLVDVTQNQLFTAFAAVTGASVPFEAVVPCDPGLAGIVAYTQAFLVGGAPLELCNANDLTLGHF